MVIILQALLLHVQTNRLLKQKQLVEGLHNPIVRKSENAKVYSSFKDNTWGNDLVDMQLISKCNKGIHFSLCVVDTYSKYVCVVPLKGKKGILIAFAS